MKNRIDTYPYGVYNKPMKGERDGRKDGKYLSAL